MRRVRGCSSRSSLDTKLHYLPSYLQILNMSNSETPNFTGWCAVDQNASNGGLVSKTFEPKPWDEDDVESELA